MVTSAIAGIATKIQSLMLREVRAIPPSARTTVAVNSGRPSLRNSSAPWPSTAGAHDLLTASHWEGAALGDILRNELQPYNAHANTRVALRGETIQLEPKAAVTLGMIVHELATNAAKYGALAQPEGRLEVEWSVAAREGRRHVDLWWRELGGP